MTWGADRVETPVSTRSPPGRRRARRPPRATLISATSRRVRS